MGQQQLLLLVLGVVIVGLAVVVGIQSFNENQRKSEVDTYTAQGVALAGDIIAYYMKPEATGGGGQDAANLATLTIDELGYRRDVYDTWQGYNRTGILSDGVVRYVAPDATAPLLHIHKYPSTNGDTRVEVYVFGPSEDCIVARNDRLNVSATWSDGGSDGTPPANPNPGVCSW
ncbi:hypothetical protein [Rubrivirga marina]|uniref:Uncharacterized protein n=1 Tax=Rubrivirga marina TaxID=1196024 RepID=A0A271J3C6_9BACT|nr:hypothetical protein [Rubrivirga marina]PAP77953.1 hypothetical protein BSZ37_16655 [Rubrivirga marina]